MLNKMVPMPIIIVTVLGMLTIAIVIYAISKENEGAALFTLIVYGLLASGMYFYVENKVTENYIKENQVNIYMNGEPVSENFNIEAINLRYYRIKIDGENVFLEKR